MNPEELESAYARLLEEKRIVDSVVERLRAGAILTDEAGVILLSNKAARDILGRPLDPGTTIQEGMGEFRISPTMERIFKKDAEVIPARASRPDPKYLHLAIDITKLESGKSLHPGVRPGWVWVIRDVTKQVSDERLSRDFLSLISHKLRTPLTPLLGYCDILKKEFDRRKADDSLRGALDKVRVEGEKVHALVEKLLDFVSLSQAKINQTGEEQIDLAAVVKDSIANLDEGLKSRASEITVSADGPVMTAGDPLSVYKILVELVDNALKFNLEERRTVVIRVGRESDYGTLTVSDNGPGIPEEEWDRVFEKFYQIDADFTGQIAGWGLGLALVRSTAEAWKGRARIKTEAGAGTTMEVDFPLRGNRRPGGPLI